MIYYEIVELPSGTLTIVDKDRQQVKTPYDNGQWGVTLAQLRIYLHQLAAELIKEKEDKAADAGATTKFSVWTWHDKVLDDESFIEEYRKEFKK